MLNQHHPILSSLDTYIEPLIKRVLQTDKLVFHGGSSGRIEVNSITSSCGKSKGDRFVLHIPYARQNLIWNVFFDSQCAEMGPDFVFNDDTFLADFSADTLSTQVPSLAKWNPNNKDALVNVLFELLLCYKQYQLKLIEKQDRLNFEYSTLVGSTTIKNEDLEMIMLPLGSKPNEARFLISLSVDLSKLPNRSHESKTDSAMLIVTFHGPSWLNIVPQLHLSRSLEDLLGGSNNLHIPPFPGTKSLLDYIPEIKKFIGDKVNFLVQCYEKRSEFMSALIQRACVTEYDATDFYFVAILLDKSDFSFLVHIQLLPEFPKEKPIVILRSIYHMTAQDTLYFEHLNDFHYSPRWPAERMVKELLDCIMKNVQKFKSNSSKHAC